MGASIMDRVLAKINCYGVLLQDWSAHKFVNIPKRIKKLQIDLQQVQNGTTSDCSSEHLEEVENELQDL